MLATGDGTPGLKWGSTNAYTVKMRRANLCMTGRLRTVSSIRILQAGAKPFVEIGFMPKGTAYLLKPEPYQPTWIPGDRNPNYSIGWSYPPNDYAKWGELVHQWVMHAVQKYGRSEVATWYWEIWNEPDISYWHGTPEEYNKLYDYASDGLKRAMPEAKVGGPATTGTRQMREGARVSQKQFLEHCATGKNAATGKVGAPLDFITYHAKGRPTVAEVYIMRGWGSRRMRRTWTRDFRQSHLFRSSRICRSC